MRAGYSGAEAEKNVTEDEEGLIRLVKEKLAPVKVWAVMDGDFTGYHNIICIHQSLKGLAACTRNHEKDEAPINIVILS